MKKQSLLILGLAAFLASATQASQEQLAKSIVDTHVETRRTSDQLAATLTALNALTSQKKGDLRPAYDTFCAEVKKTEAAAGLTRDWPMWRRRRSTRKTSRSPCLWACPMRAWPVRAAPLCGQVTRH